MVQLLQICAVQSPGPELHLIKKVYFSKSLSHIGGKPLALCLRLAAGFMLGPSFWVFLPKLLHQPVVKISILCRVILMDPTRPPVLCHLTVGCSTFEVEVEAGGSVSVPITHNSHHPALPKLLQTLRPLLLSARPELQCQMQKQTKLSENIVYNQDYKPLISNLLYKD